MRTRKLASLLLVLGVALSACGPGAAPTPPPSIEALQATPRSAATTPTAETRQAASPLPTATSGVATTARAVSQTPKSGGILRMAITRDVPGWDLYRFTGTDLHDLIQFNHSRLLRTSHAPGCSLFPPDLELAQAWQWVNDRTLEITLRQGVRFPNLPPMAGREFVASDVVFTIVEQWPKMAWYKPITDAIDSIVAADKYTVRINLKTPFAVFPEKALMADVANIVGPEIFEGKKVLERKDQNVGLGPFVLNDYVLGVKAVHKRNANYWRMTDGIPYLDGIDQYVIPDFSSQAAAMRSGKLDFFVAEREPPIVRQLQDTAPQLESKLCYFETAPGTTMRTDIPPFNDVRVRRAISMAVDREALMKTVYLGLGLPNYTGITPLLGDAHLKQQDLPPEVRRFLEYRPDEAKKLLAEAGYPNGFTTNIIFTVRYGSTHKGVAEALVDYLGKVGIKATLEPREYVRYQDTVLTGKYDGMAMLWPASGEDTDTPIWDTHHTSSEARNRSHVNDPKMDKLLEAQRTETNEAKRRELLYEIQRYWVQQQYYLEWPLAPIAGFYPTYVKNVSFKGLTKNKVDFMTFIWLDK